MGFLLRKKLCICSHCTSPFLHRDAQSRNHYPALMTGKLRLRWRELLPGIHVVRVASEKRRPPGRHPGALSRTDASIRIQGTLKTNLPIQ